MLSEDERTAVLALDAKVPGESPMTQVMSEVSSSQ